MKAATKPCTLGPKHKWAWERNVTIKKASYGPRGASISVSLRGLYKCACGSDRVGTANHNGPDLRQLGAM